MKAIVLAAGRSTRLYPLTLENPKCLLTIGNKTIINCQIEWLKACGIDNILVVIGYLGEKIKESLGDSVRFRYFENFAKTNNLYTLHSVRDELDDDTIILFSDVLLPKDLLKRCIDDKNDFKLIVDRKDITDKTMRVKIKDNSIYDIGSHIPVEEGDGNFIGVAGYSKQGAELLARQIEELVEDNNNSHIQDYYTIALPQIAQKGKKINYIEVSSEKWIEIDYKEDYDNALKIFS